MILPIHPQPFHGEIFSSWLVRLAFANDIKLHSFCSKLLGYKDPIWNRDIDRRPAPEFLAVLARSTGQPLERLRAMGLSSLNGVLYESPTALSNSQWILPVGIFHRTHRCYGMQFCPLCLKTDTVAHFRLKWRLACHVVCVEHQCLLLNKCPACNAPIAFHRHGIGRDRVIPSEALAMCHRCGFDLREASAASLGWRDIKAFRMLLNIHKASVGEYSRGDAFSFSENVLFFKGLYVLVNLIHGRYAARIAPLLSSATGLPLNFGNYVRSDFARCSLADRAAILQAVAWLLADWPNRFIEICNKGSMTRSRITDDMNDLPFWVANIASESLDRSVYLPSRTEIIAAGQYLQARGIKISHAAFSEVLEVGRDLGRSASYVWREHLNQISTCDA